MAERSWYWGGAIVGDAANVGAMTNLGAPYTDNTFSDNWRKLFTYDRRYEGVIPSAYLTGGLAVSTTGGNVVRVAQGYALVDGKLYENDAMLDVALPNGSYTVVVRKVWATQTVRVIHNRPQSANLTWVLGDTWEIPLADVIVAGGVVTTITDRRQFVRTGSGMVKIAERIITAAGGGEITFQNIPQTYRDLLIMGVGGVTASGGGATMAHGSMLVNGDATPANYTTGFFSWTAGDTGMTVASHQAPGAVGYSHFGVLAMADRALPVQGVFQGTLYDYASASSYKFYQGGGYIRHAGAHRKVDVFGNFMVAAPVTSLTFRSETNMTSGDYNLRQGTRIAIYGIL